MKLGQEERFLSPRLTFFSTELCCLIIFYPECFPWKIYLSFPNMERKYSQFSDRVVWYWWEKTLDNFLVPIILPLPTPLANPLQFIEQYWAQLNSVSCKRSRLDLFILQRGNNHRKTIVFLSLGHSLSHPAQETLAEIIFDILSGPCKKIRHCFETSLNLIFSW